METGEHRDSVLVLTVDVNENEEAGKQYGSSQIKSCPLEDNRSRGGVCLPAEGQAGKGHVFAASYGRNVNNQGGGGVVVPSKHVLAAGVPGNPSVVLGLVADRLPGRLKDSCVITDLYNTTDHRRNGFTESSSSVRLRVEFDSSRSNSRTDTSVLVHRQEEEEEEGGGMLLDHVSGGETPELNAGNPEGGAAGPKPALQSLSPALSCTVTVKHQPDCTCIRASSPDVLDMKLSNGGSDCGSNDDQEEELDVSFCGLKDHGASDKEMKVANGGLYIVNRERASFDFQTIASENATDGTVPGANLQLQNIRSSSRPTVCESNPGGLSDHGPGGAARAAAWPSEEAAGGAPPEEDPEVFLLDRSAKRLHSPCPSTLSTCINISDSPITESSAREDSSESSSVRVRPLSLRTNPNITLSLSCDATPLSPEDGGDFYGVEEESGGRVNIISSTSRRQSAPDGSTVVVANPSDQTMISKKFGIADFFTRSLFSRKPKETKPPSQNAPGWRLFGKAPQRDTDTATHSTTTQQDFQAKECLQHPLSAGRRKNLEFEPLSTTALILEDRPANLPAKCEEEAQRHRQEYDEMVAGAKRRELKEAQRRKRQQKERIRQEESIANAMVVWNNDILPHWETMRGTRRVRELWWQGLPPSVRGRVWGLAIGNELNITPELYEIFLSRAKEKWRSYSETSSENETEDCGASLADRESSLDLIKLDISRTFPSLFIFQKGGPYHDLLHSVLGAYTCYRPDIGYVQGMSFIAAVLILNLEEADAFITFANLLNKPCQMAFFRVDHDLMLKYFAAFEVFFQENLPRLFNHFQTNSLTPDLYLIDWIFTLYSKSLPLDVACRVWDVFCRDGEESLFRTGLGILRLYRDVLLQMDFIHMAQFLTRLPDDLAPHALFSCMAATHMLSGNRRWGQVFSALMKDGSKEMDKTNSPALRS